MQIDWPWRKKIEYRVLVLPAASTAGRGRRPALIWAVSSAWMLESWICDPLLAADGVMVNFPPKVPRPMVWLVRGLWLERVVLYSVSQSRCGEFVTPVKKLLRLGAVFAVVWGRYVPEP